MPSCANEVFQPAEIRKTSENNAGGNLSAKMHQTGVKEEGFLYWMILQVGSEIYPLYP